MEAQTSAAWRRLPRTFHMRGAAYGDRGRLTHRLMTDIDGSLSVVTGGSSGIGEAAAHALATRGSHVILLARNADRLNAVVRQIRNAGGQADSYVLDLADPVAIASVANELVSAHGTPHILINNAGAGRWLPLLQTTDRRGGHDDDRAVSGSFQHHSRAALRHVGATKRAHRQRDFSGGAACVARRGCVFSGARSDGRLHRFATGRPVRSGITVTLAMFGTVDTPYWEHNPGSKERLPHQAARLPVLSSSMWPRSSSQQLRKAPGRSLHPRRFACCSC